MPAVSVKPSTAARIRSSSAGVEGVEAQVSDVAVDAARFELEVGGWDALHEDRAAGSLHPLQGWRSAPPPPTLAKVITTSLPTGPKSSCWRFWVTSICWSSGARGGSRVSARMSARLLPSKLCSRAPGRIPASSPGDPARTLTTTASPLRMRASTPTSPSEKTAGAPIHSGCSSGIRPRCETPSSKSISFMRTKNSSSVPAASTRGRYSAVTAAQSTPPNSGS